MTAQRISQTHDLLYYREKMRNTCSPQGNRLSLAQPKKPHGTWEYQGCVTKNALCYEIDVFSICVHSLRITVNLTIYGVYLPGKKSTDILCTSWLTILLSLAITNKLSLSVFRCNTSRSYYYAVEAGQQMSHCTVCQKVVEYGGKKIEKITCNIN